ncbi:MAG: hypothetical protein U0414_29945 [Polyangiaceae bacterium]
MAKKKKAKSGAGGGPKSKKPAERARPSSPPPKPEAPERAPEDRSEELVATDARVSAAPEDEAPAPADEGSHAHAEHPKLEGAPWARFLVTVDKYWTWFEWRFLFVVLAALIFFAVSWVALGGLSAAVPKDYGQLSWFKRIKEAGGAFRALFGFAVLGGLARLATRKLPTRTRTYVTLAAILVGVLAAPLWRGAFVEYADNWRKWLQSGSSFTMFGGLRGTMSRITILLAMLGASLAAASGKHIYIDVVQRFVKPGMRKLMFAASTGITIAVCFVASWGFLDYISIESFGAKIEWNANQRTTHLLKEVSKDLFLWRKQVGLDFKAFPHVLGGGKWDDAERMNGRQWNEFLEGGGFRDRYPAEDVDALMAKGDQLDKPWQPQVYKPPHGQPLNLLVHAMNLLFPFGLFMIGLRFLLRLILVLTDHQPVEAEAEEYAGAKNTAEDLKERADAAAAAAATRAAAPADEADEADEAREEDEPAKDEAREEDEPAKDEAREEDEPAKDEASDDEPAKDEPSDEAPAKKKDAPVKKKDAPAKKQEQASDDASSDGDDEKEDA